jgi:hypothetical protein
MNKEQGDLAEVSIGLIWNLLCISAKAKGVCSVIQSVGILSETVNNLNACLLTIIGSSHSEVIDRITSLRIRLRYRRGFE